MLAKNALSAPLCQTYVHLKSHICDWISISAKRSGDQKREKLLRYNQVTSLSFVIYLSFYKINLILVERIGKKLNLNSWKQIVITI